MLDKVRLEKEIKAVKEAIENLKKILVDSKDGIELNEIVLKSFEDALNNLN